MSLLLKRLMMVGLLMLTIPLALALEEPVSTGFFNNVAAGGHDVTAYHQLSPSEQAVEGEAIYTVNYKGADWHFVTAEDSQACLV